MANESEVAYRRFVTYLASNASGGHRSLVRVAASEGIDESSLREQATRYSWRERAAAHDAKAVEKQLSQGVAVQRRSVVRQVQIAERVDGLLAVALDRLEGMLDNADDGDVLAHVNNALDLVKTAQRSAQLLRTAVGLPTSTTRVEVNVAGFGADASDKPDYDRLNNPTVQLEILGAAHALETIMRGTAPEHLHPSDARSLARVETALTPAVDGESTAQRYMRIAVQYGISSHG